MNNNKLNEDGRCATENQFVKHRKFEMMKKATKFLNICICVNSDVINLFLRPAIARGSHILHDLFLSICLFNEHVIAANIFWVSNNSEWRWIRKDDGISLEIAW